MNIKSPNRDTNIDIYNKEVMNDVSSKFNNNLYKDVNDILNRKIILNDNSSQIQFEQFQTNKTNLRNGVMENLRHVRKIMGNSAQQIIILLYMDKVVYQWFNFFYLSLQI